MSQNEEIKKDASSNENEALESASKKESLTTSEETTAATPEAAEVANSDAPDMQAAEDSSEAEETSDTAESSTVEDAHDQVVGSESTEEVVEEEPSGTEASQEVEEETSAVDDAAEEGTDSDSAEEVIHAEDTEDSARVIHQYTETPPQVEGLEADTYAYYYKLLARADELVQTKDWAFVIQELGLIQEKWGEGPDYSAEVIKKMREDLESLEAEYQEKRKAHYEKLNARKEENLEKKKAILQELCDIVEQEKWNAQGTVNKLKNRFEAIRLVDRNELEKMEKQFNTLVTTFEEKKVELMVERARKEEENLQGKLYVLDKLTKLNESLSTEIKDWKDVEAQLMKINKDWKKIGRIPAEKTREVYDQFYSALDDFYKKRMQFDKQYGKRMERALEKKKELIEEAELLLDDQDLATAAQRVNILHRNWKKADNLPQKDENELWNRFKEATDKFNQFKQDNLDKLRDLENQNLELKEKIIERAQDLQNPEDWNGAADKMQALLDEWKAIGPVPIRKAKTIWNSFKKEMDTFYDNRRGHFKSQRKEQKDNFEKKMAILEQLRALKDEADIDAAQNKAKELQNEFKTIGFVPIKQKNKVWRDYREVCDEIYGHFREMRKTSHKINAVVANEAEEGESNEITKKRMKKERIRQEIGKLSEEVIKTRESLTYFKTDDDSNPLIMDILNKIETNEKKLADRRAELAELKKDIELSAKAEAEAAAENEEDASSEEE